MSKWNTHVKMEFIKMEYSYYQNGTLILLSKWNSSKWNTHDLSLVAIGVGLEGAGIVSVEALKIVLKPVGTNPPILKKEYSY